MYKYWTYKTLKSLLKTCEESEIQYSVSQLYIIIVCILINICRIVSHHSQEQILTVIVLD